MPHDLHLISTCGPVREENQDAGVAWRGPGDAVALVVSDGMGGHDAGREASRIVVRECVEALTSRSDEESWGDALRDAVGRAQSGVREAINGHSESAMGATAVLAVVETRDGNPRLHLAHVGDSRVYLFRGRSLYRLTEDHSLVARMVRDGLLEEDEAFHHPDRNVIQRAIGQEQPVEADVVEAVTLEAGDLVLVSSDGLHGAIPEVRLADEIAGAGPTAEDVCRTLVAAALAAGSDDNVTVGCVRVAGRPRPRRPTRTGA